MRCALRTALTSTSSRSTTRAWTGPPPWHATSARGSFTNRCRASRGPATPTATCALGDLLVFLDADVVVPRTLLVAILEAMRDPACVGGGVDVDYRPRRSFVRLYLRMWSVLGRFTGMVQGAAQICRGDVFSDVGGYDESVWIGEDVDF